MKEIRSKHIGEHFQTLQDQRQKFYREESLPFHAVWQRPRFEKWSIGETLYHLILMCRFLEGFLSLHSCHASNSENKG